MYRIRWGVGAGHTVALLHSFMVACLIPFATLKIISIRRLRPGIFLRSPQIKSTYAVRELWEA